MLHLKLKPLTTWPWPNFVAKGANLKNWMSWMSTRGYINILGYISQWQSPYFWQCLWEREDPKALQPFVDPAQRKTLNWLGQKIPDLIWKTIPGRAPTPSSFPFQSERTVTISYHDHDGTLRLPKTFIIEDLGPAKFGCRMINRGAAILKLYHDRCVHINCTSQYFF